MPNREELAWAAGFFDGEGYIGLKHPLGPRGPYLNVTQVDPFVLHRFQTAVGVGAVQGPYQHKRPNSKPYWRFQTQKFEHVQAIAAALWSFTSPVKRAQMRTVLAAVNEGGK